MRPYVICHMLTSIDGKVTGSFLYKNESLAATELYYKINRDLNKDAFACGRVTMIQSFTGGFYPQLSKYSADGVTYTDSIKNTDTNYFAVSFDRCGRVGWQGPKIKDDDEGYDNAHIIEVLTEKADKRYLAYLDSIGVSYILAGNEDIDIPIALQKLYKYFGIKRLLLEGGSIINGAFLKNNCVDELSLVVSPVIADTCDKPLFNNSDMNVFTLSECTRYGESIHLIYKKREK